LNRHSHPDTYCNCVSVGMRMTVQVHSQTVRMKSAKSEHIKGPYVLSITFLRILMACVIYTDIHLYDMCFLHMYNSRNVPGKLSLLRVSRSASEH